MSAKITHGLHTNWMNMNQISIYNNYNTIEVRIMVFSTLSTIFQLYGDSILLVEETRVLQRKQSTFCKSLTDFIT
jgi:hypothetical protein